MHGPHKVQVETPTKRFGVEILRVHREVDAGVENGEGDFPDIGFDLFHGACDRCGICNIHRGGPDVSVRVFRRQFFKGIAAAGASRDGPTRRGELQRHRPADPGTGARDPDTRFATVSGGFAHVERPREKCGFLLEKAGVAAKIGRTD